MKKLFLSLSMALCLFAGCTEDEVVSGNAAPKGSIQATIEENVSQSRLAVNSDNSVSWMQGDAFEMFAEDGASETWTLDNVSSGVGVFNGNIPEGTLKYAFYPSSATNKPTLSETIVSLSIPGELTYSPNATCDLPMYADISGVVLGETPIEFKYLTAMLKINVNEIPVGFHTLKVSASQPIAGNFSVDLSNGNVIASDEEASQKKEVTVSFDAISGFDNDRMFYLPLIPGNYESLKVSISNGDKDILLKEWTNRSIQVRKVYWASLMAKESDATNPEGVTSEFASLTAENPTVKVTLTETVVATDKAIEVPVVEGVNAVATLAFEKTPTTDENTPLIIEEAESASANASEVSREMVLSFPDDDNSSIYLNLETPQNTVTIESGKFKTIVAATAANTFVVCNGVSIENLIIKAGNVVIQQGGEITGQITRHQDNQDEKTMVVVEDGVTLDDNHLGENVVKVGGKLEPDTEWYSVGATDFELDTPQKLYGFMTLLEGFETFEGKTVKLANDIDMFGYPLETSGMLVNISNIKTLGFKGVFDGQGYSIKNLELTYVPSETNDISTQDYVLVGLIPLAYNAIIQNVTVAGGQVYVPSVMPDQDVFYCSPLVAHTNEATVVNCHNVGCDVVLESNGSAAGVVGGFSFNNLASYLIACSNSGSIKSTVTSSSEIYNYIGGVTSGRWGSTSYVVACFNTGTVTGSCIDTAYAGGVVAEFAGENYLYACFNDAKVSGVENSGDLVGGSSYSGYYNYSCYTGDLFSGLDFSGNVTEIKKVSSYAEAVETLNAGIAAYNALATTTVPCEYRFVEGDTPKLEK